MNEFVVYDGLPYLVTPDGKFLAVRWDSDGFTVGNEVDLPVNADEVDHYAELSIMAQCAADLDSIKDGKNEGADLDSMTVKELKAFAEEKLIDIGDATKKADVLSVIKAVLSE